ncbi:hypothetical protein KIW84_045794 [Lathyrus oleraceus]|uniref:Uncharacterized protein n=1 Tax=Pisum sativum TaxID=3888 RepID=A0A9D4XLK3_PEA|nr:hypothetical protein KIW84_045794 [Pisum sativum]
MTGLTPPESGSCKKVASMSLAENQLTGALPPEFGNLISLQVLMNKLNGTIPIQISQLQKVVYIEFEPEFSGWTDSPGDTWKKCVKAKIDTTDTKTGSTRVVSQPTKPTPSDASHSGRQKKERTKGPSENVIQPSTSEEFPM